MQCPIVLCDEARERFDPRFGIDDGCVRMRRRNGTRERVGQSGVDLSSIGQMVERRGLVEAPHLDRPFDRRAVPGECQPAVRLARDRDHAAIEFGRVSPVDLKLGLAGGLALRHGGIVEERKLDRALDLVGALAREEDRSRMRIDAPYRLAAMRRGIAQQRENLLLGLCLAHRLAPLVSADSCK